MNTLNFKEIKRYGWVVRSTQLQLILLLGFVSQLNSQSINAQPVVSFTFDDGITQDVAGYRFEDWNQMILDHLGNAGISAVFFVKGNNKINDKGKYLLKSWSDAGHKIANHTYSHPYFNNKKINIDDFRQELIKTDEIIKHYDGYRKLFRFPYLKEGANQKNIDGFRQVMVDYGYKNGHVTIDASDWYIDSRLIKRLKSESDLELNEFRDFYLKHILQRAEFYEKLSYEINNRHVNHTLLLHHNLTSALFLGDLINRFKQKGWRVISADKAFEDTIFDNTPKHAGESLIWAMAKDRKNHEVVLRYPAEGSRYEEKEMNELGL